MFWFGEYLTLSYNFIFMLWLLENPGNSIRKSRFWNAYEFLIRTAGLDSPRSNQKLFPGDSFVVSEQRKGAKFQNSSGLQSQTSGILGCFFPWIFTFSFSWFSWFKNHYTSIYILYQHLKLNQPREKCEFRCWRGINECIQDDNERNEISLLPWSDTGPSGLVFVKLADGRGWAQSLSSAERATFDEIW